MTVILDNIPSDLDAGDLMRQAHVAADSDDAEEFAALLDTARRLAKPKALYRGCFVTGRNGDAVIVEGVTFTSRALSRNLENVERIFAFVATCGSELETAAPPRSEFVSRFWWDVIKTNLLQAARNCLHDHLRRRYALGNTVTMSPGSGDVMVWPIEQQRELFALLGDVRTLIGVELTDSFLMIPNKTVSGIRFPTERDFRSCQLCHREPCPSRAAPFDPHLWETMQHD
jgi:hypothetical protein